MGLIININFAKLKPKIRMLNDYLSNDRLVYVLQQQYLHYEKYLELVLYTKMFAD